MSQVSGYDYTSAPATLGLKFDVRPDVVMSFAAEGAVNFGRAVMRGTNLAKQCLHSDGTSFLGVALQTQARENDGVSNGYKDKDTVSVLTQGAVWVESAAADIVPGTAAYLVTAAGAGTFTNVDTDNLLVGKFLTAGGVGSLVAVELN